MKALKFYDKEGSGFELYLDFEKQSIMMEIDADETVSDPVQLEFDDDDIDDIILALVELKNEMFAIKNASNN